MNTITFSPDFVAGRNRELIIADGTAPEILELLQGAQVPYVALGSCDNPLQAISTVLAGEQLERLHIVAHGEPGAFYIGGERIDACQVDDSSYLLRQWKVEEIALWSCEVGNDSALVRELHHLTGASVYAANAVLGSTQTGANWKLNSAQVNTFLPFDPAVAQRWPHQLASLLFAAVSYSAEDSRALNSGEADLEGNSLKLLGILDQPTAVKYVFISKPPEDPFYSGNNARGNLYAIDKDGNVVNSYFGEISRLVKTGSTVQAGQFYVYPDPANITTGSPSTTILIDFGVTKPSPFAVNETIGTSSDPVDAALNKLLVPAPLSATAIEDYGALEAGVDQGVDAGGSLLDGIDGGRTDYSIVGNETDGFKLAETKAGVTITTVSSTNESTSPIPASGEVEVKGLYGSLFISAVGTYRYEVADSNPTVDALNGPKGSSPAETLSETFTYSVTDGSSVITNTLKIIVNGQNDSPVAAPDFNLAKEAEGAEPGFIAVGDVLDNDTDVDAADSEAISGIDVAGTITGISFVTSLVYANFGGSFSSGNNDIYSAYRFNSDTREYEIVSDVNGTPITLTQSGQGKDVTFQVSDPTALQAGDVLYVTQDSGVSYLEVATVSIQQGMYNTVEITSFTGTLAVGASFGSALESPLIEQIIFDKNGKPISVVLSKAVDINSETVNISGSAAAGSSIIGEYGTLELFAGGNYEYTPFANNPALSDGDAFEDVFHYTMKDHAGAESSSTLTISVQGSSPADPVAVADDANGEPGVALGAAVEQGTALPEPGWISFGNVLDNDTTGDTPVVSGAGSLDVGVSTLATIADPIVISAGSASAEKPEGTYYPVVGRYGTLYISSAGDYFYEVNNDTDAVDALNVGDNLIDVFNYTVSDAGGGIGGATLNITIKGSDDATVTKNDFATAQESGGYPDSPTAKFDPAGNVLTNDIDVDNANIEVASVKGTDPLSEIGEFVSSGEAIAPTGETKVPGLYGDLYISQNGSWRYVVDQTNPKVDALAADQTLPERFEYTVRDGTTAVLEITINGANDYLIVNDVLVNEASKWAVFEVKGTAGQSLTLSVLQGSAEGDANLGESPAIEIWNGKAWETYSDAAQIPETGPLYVRVAIVAEQDEGFEGVESFKLVATSADGTDAFGTGGIVDDGSGVIFADAQNADPADSNNIIGTGLDDDRPFEVLGGTFNEGTSRAVFTLYAHPGQTLSFDVQDVVDPTEDPAIAKTGDNEVNREGGDALTEAPIYYSLNGGDTWVKYDPTAEGFIAPVAGSVPVLVAVDVTNEQDDVYEGLEQFRLVVNEGKGSESIGYATLNDDGMGAVVDPIDENTTNENGSPNPTAVKDDDRAFEVLSGEFNEGSSRALFTITANEGQILTFDVQDVNNQGVDPAIAKTGDNEADRDGGDALTEAPIYYSLNGGATWVKYDPTAEGFVAPVAGSVPVLVAVDVTNEQDDIYEGLEEFRLVVNKDQSTMSIGYATLNDEGGGDVVDPIDENTTDNDGSPNPTAVKDDDRPFDVIGGAFNEGTSRAVFTLYAHPGQTLSFDVQDVVDPTEDPAIAKTGDNEVNREGGDALTEAPIYYSLNGGDTWVKYDPTAEGFVAPVAGSVPVLVVVDVTNEQDDVYEGLEQFRLVVNEGKGSESIGYATLNDDGMGAVVDPIDENTLGNDGSPNPNAVKDDDRPAPAPAPAPFTADLDPNTDTGIKDRITQDINPEFTLNGGSYLQAGGTAKLLDPTGKVVGTSTITADDVKNGTINVAPGTLDDGVYTYTAQILDASGKVVASAPVTVTVVTDLDGVMPSVELAANGGDFNGDGVADWTQNNVAQLPLASLADYQAGKTAPDASFGAIMAGNVNAGNPGAAVQLDAGAQLINISLSPLPAPLPTSVQAATPTLNFSVTSEANSTLTDIDTTRAGLQTRVVIDLQPGGVRANTFLKWDADKGTWFDYLDDGDLSTLDDGATLLDTNSDGMIDRVVVTLTDGGVGDEDGVANGVIVDPGLLAFKDPGVVYSVLMANGDRYYTTDAAEAADKAKGTGNVFEGSRFDTIEGAAHRDVYYNPFTGDWFFAAAGQPMPYACYLRVDGAGFDANGAGQGDGEDYHLFINGKGITQLVTAQEAATLGLAANGYADRGVLFNTTHENAFVFDAEAYLVANQGNADIQAFVATLSKQFTKSSDAGFVEAVEQHYLNQVELVGLAHGGSATAADLNAAFGTQFLA